MKKSTSPPRIYLLVLGCFIAFIYLFSCQDDEVVFIDFRNDAEVTQRDPTPEKITEIHDAFCDLICDSIYAWRSNNELNTGKYSVVWSLINEGMAEALEEPQETIAVWLDGMGITSSNFTQLYTVGYTLIADAGFVGKIQNLEDTAEVYWDLSDAIFMDTIVSKMEAWKATIDTTVVNAMITVAQSTLPYWRNEWDGCIDDGNPARDKKKEGRTLAWSDLWGAATGALFGGPAGALLGAVGGTLGAAIDIAINP